MRSVLQDWVMDLPLRAQGTILTGIRGCDLAPKFPQTILERYGCSTGESTPERHLAAFLRYCTLNPADPREVDIPGAWFQSKPPCDWKPSALGHYPEHYYAHLMHSFQIVGYRQPFTRLSLPAKDIYLRLVRNLHLNPETYAQWYCRMVDDRIATGEVVS